MSGYDTYNLVLNSSNVEDHINNTQFNYKFITGAFVITEGAEMCVSQITMPYSFFNLNSATYNNTTFQYRWYNTGTSYTTYTVVLPNGFYSVADINNYLQQFMISQNQYLLNTSTGYYYYFINLITDTTYYGNQLIVYPVPSSLPTGYTAPSGFVYSSAGYAPQIQILNNSFGSIVGYTAGIYPATPQTSTYNTLSNTTPNATPVNSFVVLCNIVNNPVSSVTNILDTFAINNVGFGSNIIYQPNYEKWISISSGRFTEMVVKLVDQNFKTVQANDPNVLISLLIRQPRKKAEEAQKISTLKQLHIQPMQQEF